MKRMIRADRELTRGKEDYFNDIAEYIQQAVRNIADYAYNNAPLDIDDNRMDYFVSNIVNDSEVEEARGKLIEAIGHAINRQLNRR